VRPWCNAVPKERCRSTHQLLRKGNAQSFSNFRLLSFISRNKNSNVIINSVFSERSAAALFICNMWRHTKKDTSGAKVLENESDLIDSRRVHKPFEGMVISVWEERRCSLVSFNCNGGLYFCMFQKKWALPWGGRLTIGVRKKTITSLGWRTPLFCQAANNLRWVLVEDMRSLSSDLYDYCTGLCSETSTRLGRSSHPQIGRCAREDKTRQGSHSRSKYRGQTQTVRYFKRRPSNTLALWTTVW